MRGVIRPKPVSSKRMIEDLNGSRAPFGIGLYIREVLGHPVGGYEFGPWTDKYVSELRRCVDLWLATGRRSNGVEVPAKRRPVNAINEIVERVVQASKVLPVAYRHGYSMILHTLQHSPRRDYQSEARQSAPKTALSQGDFPNEEEYRRALYQEQLLLLSQTIDDSADLDEEAEQVNVNVPITCAERMFVEMLFSDWSLKIAKCVDPRCGMYFRLAKWNHPYKRGTRCPGCRKVGESEDKKERAEDKRKWAHEELYKFAAGRYTAQILRNDSWHLDSELKSKIIGSLNELIRGDDRLSRIYPDGITAKWLGWWSNYSEITSQAAGRVSERRASA